MANSNKMGMTHKQLQASRAARFNTPEEMAKRANAGEITKDQAAELLRHTSTKAEAMAAIAAFNKGE
jgi:hypothetical protein